MSKFKVGDKVVLNGPREGEVATIYAVNKFGYKLQYDNNYRGAAIWYDHEIEHKFIYLSRIIGEPMSKYECLKQRIEALDDGWNKEADDITLEIKRNLSYGKGLGISPSINICLDTLIIVEDSKQREVARFTYNSQCQKMQAFKSALLWLLDHSDMKNEKQDKIKELEAKVKEIQREIKELK